jgi:hypothetical protein
VETSAGEPLISTWPFAGAKWLVSKESPVSQASSLVILKSATVSHPILLSSSPYNPTHKKHKGYKTLCFPYYEKEYVQECLHICLPVRSSGVCNLWPVSRQEPMDAT